MTMHPVEELTDDAVIIRAVHERGAYQDGALLELERRGLWLTVDQKVQAGLASYWPRGSTPPNHIRYSAYNYPL